MLEMDLGVKEHNGMAVVSSRDLARVFERQHDHVLREIQDLISVVNMVDPSLAFENFLPNVFMNRGKCYPEYLLNKKGFMMLTMGFTVEGPVPNKLRRYGCDNDV